jgi:hypothetical protein
MPVRHNLQKVSIIATNREKILADSNLRDERSRWTADNKGVYGEGKVSRQGERREQTGSITLSERERDCFWQSRSGRGKYQQRAGKISAAGGENISSGRCVPDLILWKSFFDKYCYSSQE